MTRKDFTVIAQALKDSRPPAAHTIARCGWLDTRLAVADALEAEYPNFRRDLFLAYIDAKVSA